MVQVCFVHVCFVQVTILKLVWRSISVKVRAGSPISPWAWPSSLYVGNYWSEIKRFIEDWGIPATGGGNIPLLPPHTFYHPKYVYISA